MRTLLLIDAHSILHRSFHALPPLTAPDGRPTQALYGLSVMLTKIFETAKPDYAAGCFDLPEPTFRHTTFKGYKAQRPKTPDALASQLQEAPTVFTAFGIRSFSEPGFEGDDFIATLTEHFKKEPDLQIVILTGDLDTLQLVDQDHIVVRTFRKGLSDTFTYNEPAVRARYGLNPEQIGDYKALVGDSSDNIPGVPGVGPKTATEALVKYGTLEKLFASLLQDPKLSAKFAAHRTAAELAKTLVTLQTHAPIGDLNLENLATRDFPGEAVPKLFRDLGFESLLRRIYSRASTGDPQAESKTERTKAAKKTSLPKPIPSDSPLQSSIFDHSTPTARVDSHSLTLKNNPNEFFLVDNVACTSAAVNSLKIGFELKQATRAAAATGQELPPPYFDLGVAFWLIDPDFKKYNRGDLVERYLKRSLLSPAEDDRALYQFAQLKLQEYELAKVFQKTEMLLLPLLVEVEDFGIGVSASKLTELKNDLAKKIRTTERKIYHLAGREFNLNSPAQLSEVLYRELQIPTRATTKSFPSTSAERLQEIQTKHPIVPLLLTYRSDFKVESTYVEPILRAIDTDGRLRTEYVQTGTATGRLSSKEPNLQNIPHGTPFTTELRSAFCPAEGYEFLSFDYAQLELRILAELSLDERMLAAFRAGEDIHAITAARVYHKNVSAINSAERRVAKTLNFGLIYGMGASAFAATSGLSRKDAGEFIQNYWREFPGVAKWQQETKRVVHERGYTETLTGRRRYFPELLSEDPRLLSAVDRAAVNHPVQGLEGDVIKQAMLKVREVLSPRGFWGKEVHMLLSIHDELLFEVRIGMMKEIAPLIEAAMEQALHLPHVKLVVEAKTGKDWGHMNIPHSLGHLILNG